jgi:hypothetical protein
MSDLSWQAIMQNPLQKIPLQERKKPTCAWLNLNLLLKIVYVELNVLLRL